MAKKRIHTVAVLGSRGGSGKSTMARLIALGASLEGVQSAVLSTDVTRAAQVDDEKRPYSVIDTIKRDSDGRIDAAATTKNVVEIFNQMIADPDNAGGLLVIDGAGFNSGLYTKLTEHVDLTIVCALADSESVRATQELWPDLADPKEIVVNNWNGMQNWQNDREVYIEQLPSVPLFKVKRLEAVTHMTADFYRNDSRVNGLARATFLKVAQRVGVLSKDEVTRRVQLLIGK